MEIKTNKKLEYLATSGFIILGSVIGSLVGTIIRIQLREKRHEEMSYTQEDDKLFESGEHIIAIPIDDPRYETKEYEVHIGYEPVGISTSAYGRDNNSFGDGYILYENNCEIIAHPTGKDDEGNLIYDEFGYPVEYSDEDTKETAYIIEYLPGEHVISIPLDSYQEDLQFEYYDGYEPVGISTTAYGKDSYHPGGGCILYTNTEKVEKEKNNNKIFGNPIEEQKTKQK